MDGFAIIGGTLNWANAAAIKESAEGTATDEADVDADADGHAATATVDDAVAFAVGDTQI